MKIFWEIPISEMSREYLLDEHRTHHCLWALYKRNRQKNPNFMWMGNTLEMIKERHDLIVEEMIKRGYAHNDKGEIDEGCEIVVKKKSNK